MPYSMVCNR